MEHILYGVQHYVEHVPNKFLCQTCCARRWMWRRNYLLGDVAKGCSSSYSTDDDGMKGEGEDTNGVATN
jgi:hypothetical protein